MVNFVRLNQYFIIDIVNLVTATAKSCEVCLPFVEVMTNYDSYEVMKCSYTWVIKMSAVAPFLV